MASAKATVQSFEQAEEFLAGGRSKTSRPLANNTYVERRTEDRIAIRLHATDVVEFTRSGLIFLNTGGWRTVTTKDRINMALPGPLNLISRRGVWRVTTKTKVYPATEWSQEHAGVDWDDTIPFADGIAFRRINDGWEPVAGTFPSATEEEKVKAAKKALDKDIKRYLSHLDGKVAEWQAELKEKGSLASSGDPWCCLMGMSTDNEHLWLHLREGYVFPTILRKALEDSGRYRDPVQRLLLDISMGWADSLKRELRKYLLKHLDPAVTVRNEKDRAEHWLEAANEVLTRPSDFAYYGKDETLWVTSAPTFGRNRDSEYIENANFEVVWDSLVEEFPDLVKTDQDRNDENPGGIYVHGASHWMCGWVEQIVVPVLKHPGLITADNLHPAFLRVCEAADATKMYPALPGAEERAGAAETADIVKDIKGWQEYVFTRSHDPYIVEFTPEELEAQSFNEHGERDYDWSADGVIELHKRACWQHSLAQVEGQGVLL